MISFQQFIKEQDSRYDLRTEIDDIARRIRRADMIIGNSRAAEINDINDAFLTLRTVTRDFVGTLDDIATGRSVHL